jgi:hypothetical protein
MVGQRRVFTLNGITSAVDTHGKDVTKAARLLHGAIVGDVRNIFSVEGLTPVARDDDDES